MAGRPSLGRVAVAFVAVAATSLVNRRKVVDAEVRARLAERQVELLTARLDDIGPVAAERRRRDRMRAIALSALAVASGAIITAISVGPESASVRVLMVVAVVYLLLTLVVQWRWVLSPPMPRVIRVLTASAAVIIFAALVGMVATAVAEW